MLWVASFRSRNILLLTSAVSRLSSRGTTNTWLMTGSEPRATAPGHVAVDTRVNIIQTRGVPRHLLSRGGFLHTSTESPSEAANSENFSLDRNYCILLTNANAGNHTAITLSLSTNLQLSVVSGSMKMMPVPYLPLLGRSMLLSSLAKKHFQLNE